MVGNSVVQRPNWWRRVASIRFLSVFLLFSVTTIWASPGCAQDWQRLDDGRVVIEVFGEKLAFYPEDGRMVEFWRGASNELFDLEDAIADPTTARRLLGELSINDRVWVVVGNDDYWMRQQSGRKFLGRFDWSKIPTSGFPDWLSFSVLNVEGGGDRHPPPESLPNQYYPKAIGPRATGFTAYPRHGIVSARSCGL